MKILNRILEGIIAIIVIIMVLGCTWQVITRFIMNDPSKYTEELLRYALIWLTMLGTPYAYGKERHLSINVLTRKFDAKGKMKTNILIEFVVLFLSIAIFIVGGIMVTLNSSGQISAALQMPMELYYVCAPISGALMVVYSVNRLLKHFKTLKEGA